MKKLDRIFYIEDEPDLQTIVKITLESIGGFTVGVCDCGDDAIIAAPAFRPDIVLLDMMMPGLNGIETLSALKALPDMADTPVVFVTAKAGTDDLARYRKLGAAGTIPKPFDPVTLSDEIRHIWEAVVLEDRL